MDAGATGFVRQMDYYEELGIHPDATTGEIREAYKLAARLVHPDKQQDPRLKKLAECQMKRLSDVVAVLAGSWERARYDAGLRAADATRTPGAAGTGEAAASCCKPRCGNGFGFCWVSMTMGTGVWYALAGGADAPAGTAARWRVARTPERPVMEQGDRAAVRKRPEKIAKATDGGKVKASSPARETLAEEPQPNVSAPASTAVIQQWLDLGGEKQNRRQRPAEQNARRPRAGTSGNGRFAGEWLYAADGREEDRAGTYPARYVELRLREAGGLLAGDYRAVHRLPDKAISPEVAFRVRGESPQGTERKVGMGIERRSEGRVGIDA